MSDEMIEIPDEVVVPCPLVDFKLRRLAMCAGCPKFGGLEDDFPDPANAAPFHRRYILKCFGAPVKRPLSVLTED